MKKTITLLLIIIPFLTFAQGPWEFNTASNTEGWIAKSTGGAFGSQTVTQSGTDLSVAFVTGTGNIPSISLAAAGLNADTNVNTIEIRLKNLSTATYLRLGSYSTDFVGNNYANQVITANDTGYKTYTFDVTAWSGSSVGIVILVKVDNATAAGAAYTPITGQSILIDYIRVVAPYAPTLSITNSPRTYTGSALSATVTSNSGGAVTSVKYNGSTTVPTAAGTYAVTANVAATATYSAASGLSAGNLVISKATPTATLTVSNSPVAYTASGQSATVTASAFSVPGSVTGILTGGSATQTAAGTYAVTASYVPTDSANYNTLTGLSAGNFVISSSTTTWNGSSWNFGTPTAIFDAVIDGTYSTTTNGAISANSLTVNATRTLTINSGTNVTVQNAVTNNGTLTIQNNANLIQVNNVANTGSVTVNRNSNPLYRLDYTMWSSPVSSQNLFNFSNLTSAVTPIRFYTYNSGNNQYAAINPVTNSFAQGTGYLIRMPNVNPADQALTTPYYLRTLTTGLLTYNGVFTGTPNNGTITLSGLTSGNYYAVGNPYPSTVSANAFLDGNSTAGTLYFWRKTNGGGATAYATYTRVGGVTGTPTAAGGLTPNGTIQVGQGFIVKATSSSLSFTNAMRTSNTANQFFKTKKVADKSRVWLNLSDATGGLNQAMIAYIDGATLGVDAGYDGKYFNDSAIALTSTIDSDEYVIQARPAFDATDVVALSFKTDVAGDYSISLDSFDGVFAEGQDVYLVDAVAGKEIDLKTGSYSFTATAGVDNTRFSLKYQKTLKVDAPAFNENSVKVYKNNGAIVVNSTAKAIKTIAVYDLQGRLIAQQKNVNATTTTISNLKAVRQVLIVKISADDNSVVSKKVLN